MATTRMVAVETEKCLSAWNGIVAQYKDEKVEARKISVLFLHDSGVLQKGGSCFVVAELSSACGGRVVER